MIEGKLSSDGHEPSGVQVIFEPSRVMALHDEGREFVRKESDNAAEMEPVLKRDNWWEVKELRDALQKANEQIAEFQLKV